MRADDLREADRRRVQKIVNTMEKPTAVLKSIVPDVPDAELASVSHDIADYSELSIK